MRRITIATMPPIYDPDEIEAEAQAQAVAAELDGSSLDSNSAVKLQPVGIGKLIDSYPDMRPIVIDGILRRGETANIIAAAKVGKSFLAGGLAWSVATGIPWLTHDVTEGRVLIIDNELHPETLASRLNRIATEMMIRIDDYAESIDVIAMRGQNVDIHAIQGRLATIKPRTYALVVVDALYRTLPAGANENDNAAMMAIYNRLDHYAAQWDCAIAVVHHASKGAQGDKSVTDVGSGAGSISRAADTHIVIRPHEDASLSVLECVTRSFKSPAPVSIRFDWPQWSAVGTEPAVSRPRSQATKQRDEANRRDCQTLVDLVREKNSISLTNAVKKTGFKHDKIYRLVASASKDESLFGQILQQTKTNRKTGKIATFLTWVSSTN